MAQGNPISVIGVEDLFTGQYQDSPTGTGLESNMHPAPVFLLSLLSFLRTGTAILLFPLLIACGSPGGLDSWLDTGPNDADGDGVFDQDDCDDTNADVNPLATEICDDKDNDCDGCVDDLPDCEAILECPVEDFSQPLRWYDLDGEAILGGDGTDWEWRLSAPINSATVSVEEPTAANTRVYFDVSGDYEVTVIVTDDKGTRQACTWACSPPARPRPRAAASACSSPTAARTLPRR